MPCTTTEPPLYRAYFLTISEHKTVEKHTIFLAVTHISHDISSLTSVLRTTSPSSGNFQLPCGGSVLSSGQLGLWCCSFCQEGMALGEETPNTLALAMIPKRPARYAQSHARGVTLRNNKKKKVSHDILHRGGPMGRGGDYTCIVYVRLPRPSHLLVPQVSVTKNCVGYLL